MSKLLEPTHVNKVTATTRRIISNHAYLSTFIFLSGLIFLFYRDGFKGYFQSDEWFYFTQFLPLTRNKFGLFQAMYKSIVDANVISGGGHLTPIYNTIWFLHNQFFGVYYFPYFLGSILVHICNSYLVFLLVSQLKKSKAIGFWAGVFFAITSIHYQAITWIMAYVPTEFSVLFILLSLTLLMNTLRNSSIRDLVLTILFFICALLTKESAVILFILVPLITIIYSKKKKVVKTIYKMTGMTGIVYFSFRFLLPKLLNQSGSLAAHPIDPILFILRCFTYPLKMITEVFVPMPWILSFVEFITPYAYPQYASDKAVRGLTFLTFTQSVGSDIVVYCLGFIIILTALLGLIYSYKKNKSTFFSLLLSLVIIICSSLPLLFVAQYAPWWGYVTFIDSRHIYLASIGGAIIFALILDFLMKLFKRPAYKIGLAIVFLSVFGVSNYLLLHKQLSQESQVGIVRKSIISSIVNTVQKNTKRLVILVDSDTGYYGFPSIPPFQTGLGQVLAINLYQKDLISENTLHDLTFSGKGPLSQGYSEYNKNSYGYYTSMVSFLTDRKARNVLVGELYSFHWDGKNNILTDTTESTRSDYQEIQNIRETITDWHKGSIGVFNFLYPTELGLVENNAENSNETQQIELLGKNDDIELSSYTKDKSIFFHEYIPTLYNDQGELIKDNFKVKTIIREDGTGITTVTVNSHNGNTVYIPSSDGASYLVIRNKNSTFTVNGNNDIIDSIIRTVYQKS